MIVYACWVCNWSGEEYYPKTTRQCVLGCQNTFEFWAKYMNLRLDSTKALYDSYLSTSIDFHDSKAWQLVEIIPIGTFDALIHLTNMSYWSTLYLKCICFRVLIQILPFLLGLGRALSILLCHSCLHILNLPEKDFRELQLKAGKLIWKKKGTIRVPKLAGISLKLSFR